MPPSLTTKPSASATVMELPTDVPPSSKLSSAAVVVTKVPPSFNPLVPSCEATSKSIAPSEIVTSLSSLIDMAGVVPTVLPKPITKSSAESSRAI